jgi:hypothetical protein
MGLDERRVRDGIGIPGRLTMVSQLAPFRFTSFSKKDMGIDCQELI